MSKRTPAFMLIGAVLGCTGLMACVALIVGGFLLALNTPLFRPSAPAAVNRIVYVGNDSNIYVVEPFSGATTALTRDGSPDHTYNYPTWAPDARRLAFVGYTFVDETPSEGVLFSISPSGERLTPLFRTNEFFPFYLYWSPDSQVIAFLTPKGPGRLALRLAKSDQADSMREVDDGAPFYYAWAPDGSRLFTHVGGTRADSDEARLAFVSPHTSQRQPLDVLPGSFQAPQWARDGHLLFSTQEGSSQAVAIAGADGTEIKKLFNYRGRVSFSASPDGSYVAYIVTEENIQIPHFGVIHVVELASGHAIFASEEPGLAFLWSPDGRKLAYLTATLTPNQSNLNLVPFSPNWTLSFARSQPSALELAALDPQRLLSSFQAEQGDEPRIQLIWKAWDVNAKETRTIATFTPTRAFLNILPYFDQYSLSSTFWSPDSRFFVYTTREGEDTGSVWIADVTGETPPRKLGDGLIAFWSWR